MPIYVLTSKRSQSGGFSPLSRWCGSYECTIKIYSALRKSLCIYKQCSSTERTIVSKNWIKQLHTLPVLHFNHCLTAEYSETTATSILTTKYTYRSLSAQWLAERTVLWLHQELERMLMEGISYNCRLSLDCSVFILRKAVHICLYALWPDQNMKSELIKPEFCNLQIQHAANTHLWQIFTRKLQ
jgi:hypothetical protein